MEAKFIVIISLTTDFGIKDSYVAEMKAVILNICPEAKMVDITHGVEKFNIRNGAFLLASALRYFPEGAIHVAVVDPGVGTKRRPIVIETEKSKLIGPDNGLMIMAAEEQKISRVHEITNNFFVLPQTAHTFHGRDIFAPVAAHLAKGINIEQLGPKITDFIKPSFSQVFQEGPDLIGEIWQIDGFGNIITNVRPRIFNRDYIKIRIANERFEAKLAKTYADAKHNEPIILMGSHGFLEIALNQGNAAEKFNARIGEKIFLTE